jgi:GNAT superfamily N-acetyltransferase
MHASLTLRLLPTLPNAKLLREFRKDAGWDPDTDAMRGGLRPDSQVEWALVQSGQKTVGIARLELARPQFCYVSELMVLKAWRGRGIGEWFMKQIELHCFETGIPRVLLQPKDEARAFYEKLDFVSDPMVAGFMKKEIAPVRRRMLPF